MGLAHTANHLSDVFNTEGTEQTQQMAAQFSTTAAGSADHTSDEAHLMQGESFLLPAAAAPAATTSALPTPTVTPAAPTASAPEKAEPSANASAKAPAPVSAKAAAAALRKVQKAAALRAARAQAEAEQDAADARLEAMAAEAAAEERAARDRSEEPPQLPFTPRENRYDWPGGEDWVDGTAGEKSEDEGWRG